MQNCFKLPVSFARPHGTHDSNSAPQNVAPLLERRDRPETRASHNARHIVRPTSAERCGRLRLQSNYTKVSGRHVWRVCMAVSGGK